jgi:hypothetical protein
MVAAGVRSVVSESLYDHDKLYSAEELIGRPTKALGESSKDNYHYVPPQKFPGIAPVHAPSIQVDPSIQADPSIHVPSVPAPAIEGIKVNVPGAKEFIVKPLAQSRTRLPNNSN